MREIWWCEQHDTSSPTADNCRYRGQHVNRCRMVEMLLVPPGSLVISKENGDRFVELLSQAMGHLSVAIGDVARSGSDQSKRMVINAADQKVAEVWSALRALTEGVPVRSEDENDEGDDQQNANDRPDEVASLHETKIAGPGLCNDPFCHHLSPHRAHQ